MQTLYPNPFLCKVLRCCNERRGCSPCMSSLDSLAWPGTMSVAQAQRLATRRPLQQERAL